MLFLLILLISGREIRRRMLVGEDGNWRHDLWLSELIQPSAATAAAVAREKPVLTTPLPINTCSLDSLTLLPRVGPVLAGRIDAARRSGVVFGSAEELEQVKGIGPKMAARLAPLVLFTVDSLQVIDQAAAVLDSQVCSSHKQP